jgi:phosphopentomutase
VSRRAVLLVIDALGIGAMPDVAQTRPLDIGAHTLHSILRSNPGLEINTLLRLGLGHLVEESALFDSVPSQPLASYGICQLAYPGADSYLGHQEIMGTIPKPPVKTLMRQAAPQIEQRLLEAGYQVMRPLPGADLLLVEKALVIGDNLEADPGLNINLTVATDMIDFSEALRIGQIVRQCVRVSRVIVFGGPGIDVEHIMRNVHHLPNGQVGIDSPAVGVYNENLLVQHLGYGVDPKQQTASIVAQAGFPVTLIGKIADLISCAGANKDPLVPTTAVMQAVMAAFRAEQEGLVAATVQETDLAGHTGDACRFGTLLEIVDRNLTELLVEISEEDLLVICADHGNDPFINPGQHTREQVPLLLYQKGQTPIPLGVRQTLADIGATLSSYFGLQTTLDGTPISTRNTAVVP